jgi:hypothetical protein
VKSSQVESSSLIERTREVWQPRFGHKLSREEARQIAENITGFFALLAEWSRGEARSIANETRKANALASEGEAP